MTVRLSSESLAEALTAQKTRVDIATALATEQAGLVIERHMKAKISGGHRKGTKTGAIPGGPPQNISGTLRRSISSSPALRVGEGMYSVEIGPTVVYGRAVDQGIHEDVQVSEHGRYNPRRIGPASKVSAHTRSGWPVGVSYPYVQPGAEDAIESGEVSMVFHKAWARAITH